MNVDDAKRLKELEAENATLKRLLADAEVEKAALKEIAKGNFRPARQAGRRPSTDHRTRHIRAQGLHDRRAATLDLSQAPGGADTRGP